MKNHFAHISRSNSGIAILITLSIITILIAVTLEINRQVRASVSTTGVVRDRLLLSQVAASGIHAAMALLAKDRMETDYDGLHENWAAPEKLAEFSQTLSFEGADLSIIIVDELGRIQVNALVAFPDSHDFNTAQQMLWDRFLRQMPVSDISDTDESGPLAIINSIKDWIDSGDDEAISGLSGAESDYYENLEPAYRCANAPISDIHELLLIKGMTAELFYGTDEQPGIAPFLTVHSQHSEGPDSEGQPTFAGKININTAPLPVVVALLPSANETLAETLLEYRQSLVDSGAEEKLADPLWYQEIPGFADVEIDPDLITTSSNVFRIVATAKQDDMTLSVNAVVRRVMSSEGKWHCQTLSWKTI